MKFKLSMEIQDEGDGFSVAAEWVSSGTVTKDNSDLLKLYGLYKQATVGKCDVPCPSFWDRVGRAKWFDGAAI